MYQVTFDVWCAAGIDRERMLFPERGQKLQAAQLADKLINSSPGGENHTVVLEDLETHQALDFTGIVTRHEKLVNAIPYMEHELTYGYGTQAELDAACAELAELTGREQSSNPGGHRG